MRKGLGSAYNKRNINVSKCVSIVLFCLVYFIVHCIVFVLCTLLSIVLFLFCVLYCPLYCFCFVYFNVHCIVFVLCTMLITLNFNISLNSSGNDFSIHVGEVGSKGQRLSVAKVIAHENYRGSSNSYSNDIALLRLSSKAIFNDFVRPACIGTNTHGSYDYCYITGWGYTHFENRIGKYCVCLRKVL